MSVKENNARIVENIRAIAQSQGLSLTKLEVELHLGNGSIGKWKKAAKPPPRERLELIADRLGVPLYEITGQGRAEMHLIADAIIEDMAQYGIEIPAPSGDGLTDAEQTLIDLFRCLGPDLQGAVIAQLRGLAQLAKGQDSPE